MTLLWEEIASPGEYFHVARARLSARGAFRMHDHDFAELFWVNEGGGWHRVNGDLVQLSRGDLAFVRPADLHAIETSRRGGLDFTNLAFPVDCVSWMRGRYFADCERHFWSGESSPELVSLSEAQLAEVSRRSLELAGGPRTRLGIEAFLMWLIGDICSSDAGQSRPQGPDWLARAVHSLRNLEGLHGGLRRFLAVAGKSPEHVSRVARRELGLSPSQIVNRERLAHAERQLQMTSKSILEICYECGYSSPSYFYQRFHQSYGLSPGQYRSRSREAIA